MHNVFQMRGKEHEDMDKVIGDRTKQQGNDFSKIQARFHTRVKLTSADVEEVIRKRLLEKNEVGEDTKVVSLVKIINAVDTALPLAVGTALKTLTRGNRLAQLGRLKTFIDKGASFPEAWVVALLTKEAEELGVGAGLPLLTLAAPWCVGAGVDGSVSDVEEEAFDPTRPCAARAALGPDALLQVFDKLFCNGYILKVARSYSLSDEHNEKLLHDLEKVALELKNRADDFGGGMSALISEASTAVQYLVALFTDRIGTDIVNITEVRKVIRNKRMRVIIDVDPTVPIV